MLCYAMLCYTMLCYTRLYYTILYYTILYYILFISYLIYILSISYRILSYHILSYFILSYLIYLSIDLHGLLNPNRPTVSGKTSGGHFNPAVTLAVVLSGRSLVIYLQQSGDLDRDSLGFYGDFMGFNGELVTTRGDLFHVSRLIHYGAPKIAFVVAS